MSVQHSMLTPSLPCTCCEATCLQQTMLVIMQPEFTEEEIQKATQGYTVEPPKRGHFGNGTFVLSSEVVLFSEVVEYLPCIPPYIE